MTVLHRNNAGKERTALRRRRLRKSRFVERSGRHTELTKQYSFEASHILPKHKGKCSRLHGHSWKLFVSVEGPIDLETGFVMDFGDISDAVQPLIERLDHRHLGTWNDRWMKLAIVPDIEVDTSTLWSVPDLPLDFYPTSENLLIWIGDQLTLNWSKLSIEETCTSRATITKEEHETRRYIQHPIVGR